MPGVPSPLAGRKEGEYSNAGKGIANPIGQVWSGALMLGFWGHQDAHAHPRCWVK